MEQQMITLTSLPIEIQLAVLRDIHPAHLFQNVRLASRHLNTLTLDIFRIYLLQIFELSVFLKPYNSIEATVHDQHIDLCANFRFLDFARNTDNEEVGRFILSSLKDSRGNELPNERWVATKQNVTALRMRMPPSYLITIRNRNCWQGFVLKRGGEDEEEEGILQLDWKKMMAAYFSETDSLNKTMHGIANKAYEKGSQFGMDWKSMFPLY